MLQSERSAGVSMTDVPTIGHPAQTPLERCLHALEHAQWSPQAAAVWLPDAATCAATLPPTARTRWLQGLRACLEHGRALSPAAREAMLALAAAWGDWPLALPLCELWEEHAALPDWAEQVMVDALLHLGEHDAALARCRSRMFSHPRDAWPQTRHRDILAWQAFLAQRAEPIDGEVDGHRLRLEPLGHHHLGDFARQYWDPQIAELCRLPQFADVQQWHRWLDECWSYGDQRLYAVLHRDWGFIGQVSLTMHGDTGFFYYWIGRDFQGHGLGPAAVRLLLSAAEARDGLRVCYAKAFWHNARSRHGLRKLGFEALDFRPAPPNEDETLYRRGPPHSREEDAARLRWLLERMGSETRLAVPLSPR
jgi:RimJ/RimL family protein N-acetyltransferase